MPMRHWLSFEWRAMRDTLGSIYPVIGEIPTQYFNISRYVSFTKLEKLFKILLLIAYYISK